MSRDSHNVHGKPLGRCTHPDSSKTTGFYRDGYCHTGPNDTGTHTVCATMTDDFLRYTKSQGNDLSSTSGGFPGLVNGDKWCLCQSRYLEAKKSGHAPPVDLDATHSTSKGVDFTEGFTNGIPCGMDGKRVIPTNTMSAREVLQRFLTAYYHGDSETLLDLLVAPTTRLINQVITLPITHPTKIIRDYQGTCTEEYVVEFPDGKAFYFVLTRQYRPRKGHKYSVKRNSLYWRITDINHIFIR